MAISRVDDLQSPSIGSSGLSRSRVETSEAEGGPRHLVGWQFGRFEPGILDHEKMRIPEPVDIVPEDEVAIGDRLLHGPSSEAFQESPIFGDPVARANDFDVIAGIAPLDAAD